MAINTKSPAPAASTAAPTSVSMPRLQLKKSVSDKDRKFFTEQMALLLETGTPLQASLQALKKQLDNPAMVDLVEAIGDLARATDVPGEQDPRRDVARRDPDVILPPALVGRELGGACGHR